MKKAIFLIIILILSTAIAVFTWQHQNQPKRMTFAECEKIGGTAWRVDVFHPDICPTCPAYSECSEKYNNYSDICPICDVTEKECYKQSPYEVCPYDNCRECENRYLNDFKDDDEKFELCPDCKLFEDCRHEYNEKESNCFEPCIKCKNNNKKYKDIKDVCPTAKSCFTCMGENTLYSEKCPGGMKKAAEISDAAIWFQCCK